RARESTNDSAIEYRRLAIEDIDFPAGEFDVAFSSLALHYVERFDIVCRKAHHCLVPGGTFVLSVEHPVFTALAAQDWYYGQHGERLHWPVDHYQDEGPRQARLSEHDVLKYPRTAAPSPSYNPHPYRTPAVPAAISAGVPSTAPLALLTRQVRAKSTCTCPQSPPAHAW